MKLSLTLVGMLFSILAFTQPPDIHWQKSIGSTGTDFVRAAQVTSDGGYILGGYSNSLSLASNGGFDYVITKLSINGTLEWQKSFGGSLNDILTAVKQTADGGYILGGHSESGISGDKTQSSRGRYDYWVIKTDAAGNMLWQKTIGGGNLDSLYAIHQTSDGGYILGGLSRSGISGDKTEASRGLTDYWIVKLGSNGAIEWQKTIGGADWDDLQDLQITNDGGYIVGGFSYSNISGEKSENSRGLADYWILKLNASGVIQWQKTIGGNNYDILRTLTQTSDGGYLLGGHSNSTISSEKTINAFGSYDYWVLKLDASGNIIWQNGFGGVSNDILNAVIETRDGGFVLGGYSFSRSISNNNGYSDYWTLKLSSNGNLIWQKVLGGFNNEYLSSVVQATDGGFLLAGSSASGTTGDKTSNIYGELDYWIVKLEGITLDFTVTDVLCYGENTGEITVSAAGGFNNYYYSWSNLSSTATIDDLYAGTYIVTVTDGVGSYLSETVEVKEPSAALAVNAGGDAVVMYTNTNLPQSCTTLTGTVTGGTGTYSYGWTSIPAGFISSNATVTVCPQVNTTYILTVTDENGCTASDDVYVEALDITCQTDKVYVCISNNGGNQNTICVATSNVLNFLASNPNASLGPCSSSSKKDITLSTVEDNKIILYPNPTSGIFNISVEDPFVDKYSVIIYDITGRIVKEYNRIEQSNIQIDISNINEGNYMIVISDGDTYFRTFKIVKVR